MTQASGDLETLVAAVRRFAALQGAFAPATALAAVMGARASREPMLAARVMSALRHDCTVERGSLGERWLMRPAVRRRVLAEGGTGKGADAGRDGGPDEGSDEGPDEGTETDAGAGTETDAGAGTETDADTPVAAALSGRGGFAPEALDRLIGADTATEAIEAAAIALDRAGPQAPGFDRLDRLRSTLNTRRAEARTDARLAGRFFGRDAELARLADWIAAAQTGPPIRTVHVSGLPGIGKSLLLERVMQLARLRLRPVLVTLDFDRSGLDVLDAHGFFEEISRQIGDALPDAAAPLRDLRRRSAEQRVAGTGTSVRFSLPRDLLEDMGRAVAASRRQALVVLDTLEVLRGRGETQVTTLFERLDTLVEFGVAPLAVLSAGRGDALDPVPDRVEGRIGLEGLDEGAARLLLDARGVPAALWPRILTLSRGNPLLITLAARAFAGAGYDAEEIPPDADAETIGAYLYRAILSRVPDRLRRIASEGLILRSVDAEALRGIIAPALGLTLAPGEAEAALTDLATHHWLVEPDGAGRLAHRDEVRRAFLPPLHDGPPEVRAAAEAIHLRAADWYGGRDRGAALYHRLQATRFGHPMPPVTADLAALLGRAVIEELPAPARDAVLQAQGRRSGFARADLAVAGKGPGQAVPPGQGHGTGETAFARLGADALAATGPARPGPASRAPDPRAVRDLELMLERGDLREAGHVFQAGYRAMRGAGAGAGYAADSPAGLVALCYLWLAGRWAAAAALFRALPADKLHAALHESPHLRGRVLMEIQAEQAFGRLVAWLGDGAHFDLACRAHEASQRIGMAGGALDFALVAAAPPGATLPRQLELAKSLLASARAPTLDAPGAAFAMRAAGAARQSFGLFFEPLAGGGPDERQPGVRATMLQALNPYAAPAQALVADAPEGRIAAALEGLRPRLPEAAAMFQPDIRGADALPERTRAGAPDVIAALAAAGLGADWASAHVLGRALADLRLIARSAERWRRTVAGMWAYGAARPPARPPDWPPDWPPGWPPGAEADRMSAARLDRLVLTPDPVAAARRQLDFWRGAAGRGGWRLDKWARAISARQGEFSDVTGRPVAALAALLAAGAPGVIAVPLAVLAAQGALPPPPAGGGKGKGGSEGNDNPSG